MAGAGQALSHFIAALELETAAIRKKGSATRLPLHDGERLGIAERQTLYRFPVGDDIHLRDDSPIQLILQSREINGAVISVREGLLILGLDEDPGPSIPSANLVADESFLIDRLRVRLEEVRNGTALSMEPLQAVLLENSP